jgi:hypothetical protein
MIKAVKSIAQRRLELRVDTLRSQAAAIARKRDLLRASYIHAKSDNDAARVTELVGDILDLDTQYESTTRQIQEAGRALWPYVAKELQTQ